MTSADVHGKFLWHELLTTDPSAAGTFYTKVLGWKSQAWDKDPSYSVFASGKGPVGGMMKLPAESAANGGSHWVAYVGVRDIEATVAAVPRLGGRVVKAPTQIPDGGRYALLMDPQNGLFGIFTPASSGMSGPEAQEFAWHELATADHSAAFRFYHELFGWEQLAIHDMGPAGSYLIFGRHGERLGGMFSRPSTMASSWPHWLLYASVPSAAKAAEATTAAGGRVVNGPMQVPGGSWIAQLVDPQGAAIAVNQAQAATVASKPAAAPVAKPVEPAPRPAPPVLKPAAPPPKPAMAPPPKPAAALVPKPVATPKPAMASPAAAPKPAKPAAAAPKAKAATPKKAVKKAKKSPTKAKVARKKAKAKTSVGKKVKGKVRAKQAKKHAKAKKRPAARAKSSPARKARKGARKKKSARRKR
ncbi:MAG TPA: VOC family protein [Steroidobacteraceae bacterium]|nr:VOC family protein [Steroidobacteraceae bacterium]